MRQATSYRTEKRPDNTQGFTLIEVMIAIAVLTIGLLAIGSVQISSINGNTTGKMTSQAATFAADQLERLLALDFDDANLEDGDTGQRQEGSYTINWTVADTATANTRLITVTVTSGNPALVGRPVVLRALKTDSV
jgi:type IV pilus modification protein PilV